MNGALKHWKEAATVILAAGTKHGLVVADGVKKCVVSPPITSNQSVFPSTSAFDYKVLVLKRSSKSGFMPNAYVFPGGLVDPSDFSSDWLEIFKSCRQSSSFGLRAVRQSPHTRPPLFATDRSKLGSPIASEVAFRICAVRETFEESGILLVIPKKVKAGVVSEGTSCSQMGLTEVSQLWDKALLAKWRQLVIESPANFIRMCETLACIPNIWALHEWANWLTPSGVSERRRYDTAFFLCCLQDIPDAVQDEKEIVHFKWSAPSDILHSFQTQELFIGPPQVYDLGRLCRFPRLQQLHNFAQARASQGCERWMPLKLVTPNCLQMLLPGDCLYSDSLDCVEFSDVATHMDKSLDELQTEGKALHRVIYHNSYAVTALITITPKYGHVMPLLPSMAGPEPADNLSRL